MKNFRLLLVALVSVPACAYAGGAQIDIGQVFSGVSPFVQPVQMLQSPGDESRWFIVEKRGTVQVFDNTPGVTQKSEFVNIVSRTQSGFSESGLLGMAFHPDFNKDPAVFEHADEVFLSYTAPGSPLISRVARYRSTDGGLSLDFESEEILFSTSQPFSNHNGGHIEFGPDGYLYIGLGDGGLFDDPQGNGQKTDTLLGTILRIDVDAGDPYAIPGDNPFAMSTGCDDEGCPEIYAYGFRNPWRFSFDRLTGDMWAGDVGQDAWEEVDIVVNGGNYGWNIREGEHCFLVANCDTTGLIDPVHEYSHSFGSSITGGFVYRGRRIQALVGKYVFADFGSGRIWAYDPDTDIADPLDVTPYAIASFGESESGELYFTNYFAGNLYAITVATIVDTDTDGVPDAVDNCILAENALQCDGDSDGYGNKCDADFDNNLFVGFQDLLAFKTAFGSSDPEIDLDCNGIVAFPDLSLFSELFGGSPGP